MMGAETKIQWTDATWNPLRGCSKVSDGCANCYAMHVAARFSDKGMPYEGLAKRNPTNWTGKVRLVEEHLRDPLRWRKPRKVFVNSMSDLFHESVAFKDIDKIFAVMGATQQHTFQVLTKRAARALEYCSRRYLPGAIHDAVILHALGGNDFDWPLPNVWIGVSVENQRCADERIPLLLDTPAAVRFLSVEPLLGLVDLSEWLGQLDWVIVGGESGSPARPCNIEWIRSVVGDCREAGTACFVKQLGSASMGMSIHDLPHGMKRFVDSKGGDMEEWPEDLRVREFPNVGATARAR